MQLLRLEMTGIGPFAGTETIDFARLTASGLFLLEGPTGAGKSTIVDAVTFALYGRVASSGADVARMRSHHADADAAPAVVLDLETQSGIYRVRRTPAYTRIGKRTGAPTPVQMSVKVWRLNSPDVPVGGGELLSTKVREAEDEITRAVGLTRDQFVQTVVLPQGEFATFLQARSEEKGALLEQLFGTDFFRRVQDELVEAGRQAQRDRASAAEQVERALARFVDLVSAGVSDGSQDSGAPDLPCPAPAPLPDAGMLADDPQAIDALVAAARVVDDRGEQLRRAHESAEREAEQRRDALTRAAERLDRLGQVRDLVLRRAALQREQRSIDALQAELTAAQSAAGVAREVTAARRAEDELTEANAQLDAARAVLSALAASASPPGEGGAPDVTGAAAYAGELLSTRERRTALEPDRRLEADLPRLEALATAAGTDVLAAHDALESQRQAVADLPAQRDELTTRVDLLVPLAATLAQARIDAAAASKRQELGRQRDALATPLAQARADATAALQAHREAARAVDATIQRRIDGIAGELGVTLDQGEPCPVCGSLEHPRPARPAPDATSAADVDAARALATRAESRAEQAAARLRDLERRHTELDTACGSASSDELAADHERAVQRATEAESAATELAEARATIDRLTTRLAAWEATERALLAALATATAKRDQATAALEQARTQVSLARGAATSVAALCDHLDRRATALGSAIEAEHRLTTASGVAAQAGAELLDALADVGFADLADYAQAVRPAPWVTSTERAVSDHHDELARVSSQLQTPGFTEDLGLDALMPAAINESAGTGSDSGLTAAHLAATDLTDADLTAADQLAARHADLGDEVTRLRAATEQARSHLSAAGRQAAVATERALAAARALAEVEAALRRGREVLTRTADAIRVGGLASGTGRENQLNMDLVKFVLVRRFQQVLDAANEQLARICAGRYVLSHSEEKHGNSRSGLAIRVLDSLTGVTREVGTLSGGETFYVSLALALALAEVVRAESGGVELGTLFVDEGFGSLDPDVLDDVVRTLEGLRSGGRTVGVISHVPELKARIADRVEVRPRSDGPGSTLRVVA